MDEDEPADEEQLVIAGNFGRGFADAAGRPGPLTRTGTFPQ